MTWTYGDPNDTDLYAVRFLIGDTDTNDQQVSDEEVQFALAEFPNKYLAAAMVCDTLSAKFSKAAAQRTVGSLSISYLNRSEEYQTKARTFRAMASKKIGAPIGTAIRVSDKQARQDDESLVQPGIRRGQDDNLGTQGHFDRTTGS